MRVGELFDVLASGELNNLSLVKDYKVVPNKEEVVLRSINLGLTDLFTRFVLRKNSQVFEDLEQNYLIHQNHFYLNHDDFVEILNVYLDDRLLVLDVDYQMPQVNMVHLLVEYNFDSRLKVVYKAKHPMITKHQIGDLNYQIELPYSYMNALVLFMGSRLYSSIVNQLDGDLNESNRYLQRYHDEIAMLTNQGIDVDKLDEHSWFSDRGFV